MHVDLWLPGTNEDMDGNISSPTDNITAAHLAQLFCADVIFSFGMCSVVAIAGGGSFKNVLMDMCKKLGLTYWVLSSGNHEENSVKHYYWFLNKTQAIVGNNRGTHDVYI